MNKINFAQELEKILEETYEELKEIKQKRYEYSFSERSNKIKEKANEQLKKYNLFMTYVNKRSVDFTTLSGATGKGDTIRLEEDFREIVNEKAKVKWRDYLVWGGIGFGREAFLGFRDKNESKLKDFILTKIPIIRNFSRIFQIGYLLIMEPSSKYKNEEAVDFFLLKRKPESYELLEKIITKAYKDKT